MVGWGGGEGGGCGWSRGGVRVRGSFAYSECHSVIIMSLTSNSPRISLRHPPSLHGCNWSELLTSSFSFVRILQ